MRITYNPAADAVYIHLTGQPLPPVQQLQAVSCVMPGMQKAEAMGQVHRQ